MEKTDQNPIDIPRKAVTRELKPDMAPGEGCDLFSSFFIGYPGAADRQAVDGALQALAEESFQEQLLREGFTCGNPIKTCWYRVVDRKVIHFIGLYTRKSTMEVHGELGYAVMPLYRMPHHWTAARVSSLERDQDWTILMDELSYARKNPVHTQYVTRVGYASIFHYEKSPWEDVEKYLLPEMDRVRTERDAYLYHRQILQESGWQDWYGMTTGLRSEIIYENDPDMIPKCLDYCRSFVDYNTRYLAAWPEHNAHLKRLEKQVAAARLQLSALTEEDARQLYLQGLEKDRQKVISRLKKWGIPI